VDHLHGRLSATKQMADSKLMATEVKRREYEQDSSDELRRYKSLVS
jgi:hypothetical protein